MEGASAHARAGGARAYRAILAAKMLKMRGEARNKKRDLRVEALLNHALERTATPTRHALMAIENKRATPVQRDRGVEATFDEFFAQLSGSNKRKRKAQKRLTSQSSCSSLPSAAVDHECFRMAKKIKSKKIMKQPFSSEDGGNV